MLLKRIIALLIISITVYGCISFAQSESDWLSYHTDGHSKSNGINLTISYPKTWSIQEGIRPHIVQKFLSPDANIFVMILIQDLGLPKDTPISKEELDEFFTPSKLSGLALPEGMQLINAQKITIEGLPAGILEYKGTIGMSVDQQV